MAAEFTPFDDRPPRLRCARADVDHGARRGKGVARTLTRPSVHFSLGFLVGGAFVAGIVFRDAFNTALKFADTEAFCSDRHKGIGHRLPDMAGRMQSHRLRLLRRAAPTRGEIQRHPFAGLPMRISQSRRR